jgi:transcriptional regulator with XRE-family HTH domain
MADLAADIERMREDAGLSQRQLATAAGISNSTLSVIERGAARPSPEVAARIAAVLGADLAIRLYPGTGPTIHDRFQTPMIEALLSILHLSWRATPEVGLLRSVRGSIDLVLERAEPPLVACEAHSQLRRLEQQVRWVVMKSDALAEQRGRPTSRLLAIRSTRLNRSVASEFSAFLNAAYPAPYAQVVSSLVDGTPWPGAGLLWCRVEQGSARILDAPPRGIRIGR